jgi:hypothetical protein
LDDQIYLIAGDSVEPGIFIDYGKHALTRETYLKIPVTGMHRLLDRKYMYGSNYFGISRTHIFFYMNYDDKGFYHIYNKAEGRLFTASYQQVKDDLFSGGADIRSISKTCEDHFVGTADPSKMKVLSPVVFNQIQHEIAADDNPILFLFDFK